MPLTYPPMLDSVTQKFFSPHMSKLLEPTKIDRIKKKINKHRKRNRILSITERAQIKALLAEGLTPSEVATRVNRDTKTIYDVKMIHDSEVEEVLPSSAIQALKGRVLNRMWIQAARAQDSLTDEKLANTNAYQLALIQGISIDKARLIGNESTQNLSVHTMENQIVEGLHTIDAMKRELMQSKAYKRALAQ